MSNSKKKNKNSFVIKKYPKVIVLWPLMLTSLVLWLLQWILLGDSLVTIPNSILANIWMWMFLVNLLILAFDTGSAKFFGILIAVIVGLLLMFIFGFPRIVYFNITLYPIFYGFISVILIIIIGLGVLGANFDKWTFEKNEIFHKKGIFGKSERYPSAGLRYTKEINDMFELIILGAGSLTIVLKGTEAIHLPTVLRINNVSNKLDRLLSEIEVKMG